MELVLINNAALWTRKPWAYRISSKVAQHFPTKVSEKSFDYIQATLLMMNAPSWCHNMLGAILWVHKTLCFSPKAKKLVSEKNISLKTPGQILPLKDHESELSYNDFLNFGSTMFSNTKHKTYKTVWLYGDIFLVYPPSNSHIFKGL